MEWGGGSTSIGFNKIISRSLGTNSSCAKSLQIESITKHLWLKSEETEFVRIVTRLITDVRGQAPIPFTSNIMTENGVFQFTETNNCLNS